ncbi:MAG: methyltransferase domain-containing protein [Ignavibacteriaceae bacterium]|jgi:2-polyprenyl-3-methyl-5-hydroxy-6-metoxy-1,4-benzoquinol methylase|nr:methyltransferase domain-containing protein [Ignavibacteriaceae bacterium]
MNVEEAYKYWSEQYDTNQNKTRDLEAISLRETLNDIRFENCLEIGCGTGKNTEWLITKGHKIIAVDLSEEMLTIARNKISNDNVQFLKADINEDWTFTNEKFDLVVCSLVLEHIENINRIFKLISEHLTENGILYIGELHPFKQYLGSKAGYENEEGKQTVTGFTHHISEFISLAKQNGLIITEVKEYFDDGDTTSIPRILTLKFIRDQDSN